MKKIHLFLIAVFSILLLTSCQHRDREVELSFRDSGLNENSNGDGREVAIVVLLRNEKTNVIGEKEFFEDEVKILSKQDFPIFLGKSLADGLRKQNFYVKNRNIMVNSEVEDESVDRILTILINDFEYESEVGFPSGEVEFKANIIVEASNRDTESSFIRNLSLNSEKSVFVGVSEKKDAELLNGYLQQLLEEILDDDDLMRALSR